VQNKEQKKPYITRSPKQAIKKNIRDEETGAVV
jgi:hypothetical protein